MRRRAFVMIVVALIATRVATAQVRMFGRQPPAPAGSVNLPYQTTDSAGTNWMIYQMGWLQQQGQFQIYSQGAVITINGQQPPVRVNTARVDEKTSELVMSGMQSGQIQLTRRILINKE